jgi:hypothetical protein
MNYTKPEVAVLGNARVLIEALTAKAIRDTDGSHTNVPAYDLDE